jgi:hypothetical protein
MMSFCLIVMQDLDEATHVSATHVDGVVLRIYLDRRQCAGVPWCDLPTTNGITQSLTPTLSNTMLRGSLWYVFWNVINIFSVKSSSFIPADLRRHYGIS